jgi:FAD/FMN-containing dehydrogenase
VDLPSALRDIVGAAHVLTDPDLMAPFAEDWTRRWRGQPRAVVRPGSTKEVAAVVRWCADHGVPLVPQGGNTGLVGAGVPQDGELVLSTRRLSGVGPVDPLARTIEAGAGATLAEVQAAARAEGLDVGIDFAARESATVGGIAATNAGGERVLRHGVTRTQVRGVEVVLADGTVVRRMSGLPKDNSGYDLVQLVVGSEGTLGVITAVQLRLVQPAPAAVAALVAVGGIEDALAVLAAVRTRLPGLDAAEYFHDDGLQLVLRHRQLRSPFGRPHPLYLLVEIAAADGTAAPVAAEALADVLGELDAVRDAALATTGADRRRLWELRESHTEAISAAGVPVKLDVAVPLGKLPEFERQLPGVVRAVAPHAVPILFGHIAEGNVHVNLLGAADDDADGAVTDAVLHLVAGLGGSISAEHGIGLSKRRWLPLTREPGDIAAMRAVKAALDPAGILSPGRLLP